MGIVLKIVICGNVCNVYIHTIETNVNKTFFSNYKNNNSKSRKFPKNSFLFELYRLYIYHNTSNVFII